MIKVIIADDEPVIARGIEKLLDLKALCIQIVGISNDGQEALEMVRCKKPDILISDINMPNMSGIELLKILKEEKSETQVIFISGYQEFEYARAALKYGAIDYLVKPINKQQLSDAVKKIIIQKQKHLHFIDFEKEVQINEEFIANDNYYFILNCSNDGGNSFSEGEKEIIHFSTNNILEELLKDNRGHWIINKENQIYILIYGKVASEIDHLRETLPDELMRNVKLRTHQSLTIAVSKVVDNINLVNEAYEMAKDAMNKKYFYSKGSIIYYRDIRTSKFSLEELYAVQESIAKAILSYDEKNVQAMIEYYMEVIKEVALWNPDRIINYCLGTMVFVKKYIKSNSIDLGENDFDAISVVLNEQETFCSLKTRVLKHYLKVYTEVLQYISDKDNPEILIIRAYIEEHYSENIKLDTLAELAFMNPNYFSGYFKKQVGVNFKEYLTAIRMREAEKILLTSDMKVYEIAEKVGFNDYRHFSDIFKKRFGELPSEYKNKILKITT